MVTPEEIGRVPLFAELDAAQCDQLSRLAADISLVAGEYAAPQGSEPALFAVLEGRIEPVQLTEGVERVVGRRDPGEIFGEVPITLGTVFPVGFRAAEPSRVMRLEPRDFHAVAADVPDVAKEVGRLASHRMSGLRGLQGLAADPPPPRAVVVGHRWDAECSDLRRFLDRNQVTFRWITPDVPDAEELWGGPLPGEDDLPTFRIVDGKTVVRPRHRRVADLLDLGTEAEHARYDTIIVGAGPAGLAAAVYGASEGLRTLVVEREAPGGQAGTSSRIENYLGFPNGVSGAELARRARDQAVRLHAELLVPCAARSLRVEDGYKLVELGNGDEVNARAIVVAGGVSYRRLQADSCDRLTGAGVYYGAAHSEAVDVSGADVVVVGGANSAGQAAVKLAEKARTVTLLVRSSSIAAGMSTYLVDQVEDLANVVVRTGVEVSAVRGADHLELVTVRDRKSGEVEHLPSSA